MPKLETKHFGAVTYDDAGVLEFPAGLPGFENRHRFLALRFPQSDPLVYLQSMEQPELCFLAVPAQILVRDYRLEIGAEELELIDLEAGRQPSIGTEVLCLAVLSVREDGDATANLLAPLVVNIRTRRGVQAVMAGTGYSHQHVLTSAPEPVCS